MTTSGAEHEQDPIQRSPVVSAATDPAREALGAAGSATRSVPRTDPCILLVDLRRSTIRARRSRYALASRAAAGDKAVAAHGVPGRLLTDNGLALNPSRRGLIGRLVAHVAALGTEAITGKPYKPTTQGKNERFHQTLFRYLDKQPLAATLTQLQAQIDAFDHIHHTQRPHRRLPGRITPPAAWDATPRPIHPARSRTGPSTHRRSPRCGPARPRPQAYPPAPA